jgi:hypothetical protein
MALLDRSRCVNVELFSTASANKSAPSSPMQFPFSFSACICEMGGGRESGTDRKQGRRSERGRERTPRARQGERHTMCFGGFEESVWLIIIIALKVFISVVLKVFISHNQYSRESEQLLLVNT